MGKVDWQKVKPYGDTLNDGVIQLSFTLPVPFGEEAREAAKLLALQMGLEQPVVVHAADLGEDFSFFVVYARTGQSVDFTQVRVSRVSGQVMSKEEVDNCILAKFKRKLVVVGACIESDAHTVGIDAIMNMKGYNGHKGLEAFHQIRAVNLGAQVTSEELVAKARALKADAILVSQVVTQKNIHLTNLTRLAELLEAEDLREQLVLVVGGPVITHQLAKELGYDAGFGKGTYAEDAASFVVHELERRNLPNGGIEHGSADSPADK